MEANPWSAVLFIGLLFTLDAIGIPVLRTGLLLALFVVFVPVWLIAGYLWDKLTIEDVDDC